MSTMPKRKTATVFEPSHTNLASFVAADPLNDPWNVVLVTEIDGVRVSVVPMPHKRGLMISIEPSVTRFHELSLTRPGAIRNAVLAVVFAFDEPLEFKGVKHSDYDDQPFWFEYEALTQWDES